MKPAKRAARLGGEWGGGRLGTLSSRKEKLSVFLQRYFFLYFKGKLSPIFRITLKSKSYILIRVNPKIVKCDIC